MRLLLRSETGKFSLTDDFAGDDVILPPYAILSHTWGPDDDEVTFEDLEKGTGENKDGYKKILFCGEQASKDDLKYFWIDTCCINKADHTELSEAIKSMFRWYYSAAKCYVYLSDVSMNEREEASELSWESDFRVSRWFTRGWTLQELLAPTSLEFFSREYEKLGDKQSLEQKIHKITGIPKLALQGASLSQFSVNERLSWKHGRHTKLEEDMAYSLVGIFGVYIPPIYGEGTGAAFKRLMDEIGKLEKCIQDLHLSNPRDDKKRIEDTNGGLLADSYRWILENSDFQRWRDDQQSPLLWIKGDPGKGKTMLLCGIVNELEKSISKTSILSYFFCQATDSRINHATAVLRGLLYLILDQHPSLVSHVQKKHDHAGKALFEDANAWTALCEIFINILRDPNLNNAYLIIDGLDECQTDLPKLLDFIVQQSPISSQVKWIVSSRNWPNIEERLEVAGRKVNLCLELNRESVSTAVGSFIQHKVSQLVDRKRYDDKTRDAVLSYLSLHADGTFLWVALVCQNLEKISRRNAVAKLSTFPPGLDSLYERMIAQICGSDDADLYRQILASIAVAYRPITIKELTSLVAVLNDMADDLVSVQEEVSFCGSFLTIREGTIYFVHQSGKDFLIERASKEIFPSGIEETHHTIFLQSLQVMSKTLDYNMYSLRAPGISINEVEPPNPDPLAIAWYSCLYWGYHLIDCNIRENKISSLQDESLVYNFLNKSYLYWLEALSLKKSVLDGIIIIIKLEKWLQVSNTIFLKDITRNSCTNLERLMKVLRYMHLYMMHGGSLYTIDQLLNTRLFNYIVQPLSLHQRRVLSEKDSGIIFLLG